MIYHYVNRGKLMNYRKPVYLKHNILVVFKKCINPIFTAFHVKQILDNVPTLIYTASLASIIIGNLTNNFCII